MSAMDTGLRRYGEQENMPIFELQNFWFRTLAGEHPRAETTKRGATGPALSITGVAADQLKKLVSIWETPFNRMVEPSARGR